MHLYLQLFVISHRIVAEEFFNCRLTHVPLIMVYSSCEYLHTSVCLVSFCMRSVIIVSYLVCEIQLYFGRSCQWADCIHQT